MGWRRFPLPEGLRLALLGGLLLGALLAGYQAYRSFRAPERVERQVPDWRWEHSARWDYGVILKPNSLYSANALGPGGPYFTSLTERVDSLLTYSFSSDRPVRLEGWYEVSLALVADKGVRKAVPLGGRTPFSHEGSGYTLQVGVPLIPWSYEEALKAIEKEVGVALSNPQVLLEAQVEVSAQGPAGQMKDSLSPTLALPLRPGPVFTVSGEPQKSNQGMVQRRVVEARPGVGFQRKVSLGALGFLALGALSLYLFTVPGPWPSDPLERRALGIVRRYRRRMVEACGGHLPGQEAVALASIEDLARLSEELLKPMVHVRSSTPGPHLYFVADGQVRYEFRLGDPQTPPPVTVSSQKG